MVPSAPTAKISVAELPQMPMRPLALVLISVHMVPSKCQIEPEVVNGPLPLTKTYTSLVELAQTERSGGVVGIDIADHVRPS